jgi:hypothetical protein
MAANQSGIAADLLGSRMDLSGAPAAGDAQWLGYQTSPGAISSFADVGGQQRSLGQYNRTTFGDEQDYNKAREHVSAPFQRMDPQLSVIGCAGSTGRSLRIQVGSMAHQQAMDQFNRQLHRYAPGIT